MSLFVAIPVVLVTSMITYIREKEKRKQPREPFLNLPYMHRRTKVQFHLSHQKERTWEIFFHRNMNHANLEFYWNILQ